MFEYKVAHVSFGEDRIEEELNELGKERWELVQIIGNRFFFKRPVQLD